MEAKISFIISYYNAGATIQETIDSILNQDYTNYDIWIVNDGSDDENSLKKLKAFEELPNINIIHQNNSGPSVARNNAIRACESDFIVPLDADDKIAPNGLSLLLKAIESDKQNGVAYGAIQYFGEKNHLRVPKPFDWRKQLLWNQVAMCCLLRKEVFDSAGYFDETLSKAGLEDWEFWMRVNEAGWKFSCIQDTTFYVRAQSSSRTYEVANKNLDFIKAYVYGKHGVTLAKAYEELYYSHKMTLETPDYRLGHFLLKPYRFLKNLFS